MWKNSLKDVESDNNKILYETLLNFFLQRNGTYFLNKPHIMKFQSPNARAVNYILDVNCCFATSENMSATENISYHFR